MQNAFVVISNLAQKGSQSPIDRKRSREELGRRLKVLRGSSVEAKGGRGGGVSQRAQRLGAQEAALEVVGRFGGDERWEAFGADAVPKRRRKPAGVVREGHL
jgi:hypothetical protein